jgi:hypothetical protein
MAEDWNPDTGGRSLAEILREAGIERANRANRRRSWDDPDETAIRQRRAEAAADRSNNGGFGRRKSDFADRIERQAAAESGGRDSSGREPRAREAQPRESRERVAREVVGERRQSRRAAPEPSTAAIPGLRPDRKPGVPHPSGPIPSGPIPSGPISSGPIPSAPIPSSPLAEAPVRERRSVGRVSSARERLASGSSASRSSASRSAARAHEADSHPSTGPIPVVRPDDFDGADLEATPRESAMAWLRFAGELLIALAAGVGVYFAATLLWEQLPHLAVFLAPLAVAGLVAGVSMWRQRQGRDPMGPRLLALLVFAGTLLTIAPAAGLLATGS